MRARWIILIVAGGSIVLAGLVTGPVLWFAHLYAERERRIQRMREAREKLRALTAVSESLHKLDSSPIGEKWIEGFDWPEAETRPAEDSDEGVRPPRLRRWRSIADPAIVGPVSRPSSRPTIREAPGDIVNEPR